MITLLDTLTIDLFRIQFFTRSFKARFSNIVNKIPPPKTNQKAPPQKKRKKKGPYIIKGHLKEKNSNTGYSAASLEILRTRFFTSVQKI